MFTRVVLVGNVGRDPELRYTPSGMAVCNFSLAVNRSWTKQDTNEKIQETVWWRIAVWGNQAETVNQYVEKGKQILVEGSRVSSNAWIDKDGTPRSGLELTADHVRFLGRKGDDDEGEREYSGGSAAPTEIDDIPF